jgi:EAL domain-containing protein (putative c-di-GMP-specific phosphodiesterase class I)
LAAQRDYWALGAACRIAAGWPPHLTIAYALSATRFSTDLVADVAAMLDQHGVAPARLKLEFNEAVLIREPAAVRTIIAQLRALGVQILLNDFGAGHASMAYLRDYAFSGLKIAGSFTAMIATDPRSLAFVKAIIDMASALDIETIAEGVETREQLHLLRQSRVGSVQGPLLGEPMTEDGADALIHGRLAALA